MSLFAVFPAFSQGERRWVALGLGVLPALLLGWEGTDRDRARERALPQKCVTLQGLNALQNTSICKFCCWYTGVSLSWWKSWRGSKFAGFSSHWIAEWLPGLGWGRQLSIPLSYPILKAVGPGKCCLTQNGGLETAPLATLWLFLIIISWWPLVFCLIYTLQNKTITWHIFLGALLLLVPVSARGKGGKVPFLTCSGVTGPCSTSVCLAATESWQC